MRANISAFTHSGQVIGCCYHLHARHVLSEPFLYNPRKTKSSFPRKSGCGGRAATERTMTAEHTRNVSLKLLNGLKLPDAG